MNSPRTRFYRDKANGKLMGVCAGIADYTGFDVTLGHYRYGPMAAHSVSTYLAPVHRTDLRIAKHFTVGSNRCEAALTAQNLGHAYGDYLPTLKFERRLFGTLAVQF